MGWYSSVGVCVGCVLYVGCEYSKKKGTVLVSDESVYRDTVRATPPPGIAAEPGASEPLRERSANGGSGGAMKESVATFGVVGRELGLLVRGLA